MFYIEQHRLAAHVRGLAVLEGPVAVAHVGEAGRDGVRKDDRRGRSDMPVQRVLYRERDDRAHETHDAELADLVDQRMKAGVGIADQTQLGSVPLTGAGELRKQPRQHDLVVPYLR